MQFLKTSGKYHKSSSLLKLRAPFLFPRCQSLTDDVSAQCACWINQTIVIERIKEFKCQAKSNQKKVTQFKVKSRRNFTFQGLKYFKDFFYVYRMIALINSKNARRQRTSLWNPYTTAWKTTV